MSMEKQEYLQRKGEIQELKERLETLDTRITGYGSAIRQAVPYAGSPEEIDIRVIKINTSDLETALEEYNTAKAKLKRLQESIGEKPTV